MKAQMIEIYIRARDKVHVKCVENHLHSAARGCMVGDQEALDICIMAERVMQLEDVIDMAGRIRDEG